MEPENPETGDQQLKISALYRAFVFQRLAQVFYNGDYAILPASLLVIEESFDTTGVGTGFCGMIVYFGLGTSVLLSGPLFDLCGARYLVPSSVVLAGLAMGLCAISPDNWLWSFMLARFLVGLAQGPAYVFWPVWVDEFAPESARTMWMGITTIVGPLANMLFYAITSYIVYSLGRSWRIPFFILCSGTLLSGTACCTIQPTVWECQHRKDRTVSQGSVWDLMKYPSFVLLSFIPMFSHFAVSGSEYSAIKNFVALGSSRNSAWTSYVLAGITGPIAGICIGSAILDCLGGYRQRLIAQKFCLGMMLSSLMAVQWTLYPRSPQELCTGTAVTMAGFGASIPTIQGLLLDSVPAELKTYASGVISFMTNISFMVAPPFVGFVSEAYSISEAWRWCFYPAFLCPILVAIVFFLEQREPRLAVSEHQDPEVVIPETEQGLRELSHDAHNYGAAY